MEHYRTAIRLSPEYPEAHNNLGDVLVRQGRPAEALPYLERAVELNPRYASAHSNLGSALAQLNRLANAIPHLEKAIEYKPDLVDAHNNLGVALAMAGRTPEAIAALERAAALSAGKEPAILELLGRLYAGDGRFEAAGQAARRALAAASAKGSSRLVERLQAQIAEYESRAR